MSSLRVINNGWWTHMPIMDKDFSFNGNMLFENLSIVTKNYIDPEDSELFQSCINAPSVVVVDDSDHIVMDVAQIPQPQTTEQFIDAWNYYSSNYANRNYVVGVDSISVEVPTEELTEAQMLLELDRISQ
jgi:hypothetical protein